MALPCYRPAFGPGVTVGRKAGRLETEQKLPREEEEGAQSTWGTRGSPLLGFVLQPLLPGFPPHLFQVYLVSRYRNAGGIFSSRKLLGASALGWELGVVVVPDVLIGDGQVGGSHARGVLQGEDTGGVSAPPTHSVPLPSPHQPCPTQPLHRHVLLSCQRKPEDEERRLLPICINPQLICQAVVGKGARPRVTAF